MIHDHHALSRPSPKQPHEPLGTGQLALTFPSPRNLILRLAHQPWHVLRISLPLFVL